MPAAITHRPLLLAASAATYAAVTVALVALETPGLGLGHLFYLAIALLALASGPFVGAAGGALALGLYAGGTMLNESMAAGELLDVPTAIRTVTYIASGALIGWFARVNRALATQLEVLADRDFLTGVLNARAFERSLGERCAASRRFTLLLGDVDGLKRLNDSEGHSAGNDLLARAASGLVAAVRDGDEVARVGGDEFAVLAAPTTADEARSLAVRIEQELAAAGAELSVGWAVFPVDGATPDALHHRADERLYASKASRGTRRELAALLPRRSP